MRVERADGHGNSRFQSSLLRPRPGQAADRSINGVNASRQPRTQLAQLRIKLRQKFRVGIAVPIGVPHRLVAGGANARGEFVRRERAGQFGGNKIGKLNPRMRGVEHGGFGAQAMQNFAEKPFARIRAAALGEILRADFFCQRGDFGGLGDAGVVFPQPRHRGGIACEFLLERERLAFLIHGQRRAAGGVNANADDLAGAKTIDRLFRRRERLFDGDFRAADVIGGMLPRQIRVAGQNHARRAVGIIPNRRRDFRAVGDIDDERANRVRAVVQSNCIFCWHKFFGAPVSDPARFKHKHQRAGSETGAPMVNSPF